MKKIRLALLIALPVLIALLAALFVCTLKLGSFVESSELDDALALVFTLLLTVIPTYTFPVFAGVLLLLWILLLAGKRRANVALLVFLSILLPILLFTLFLNAVSIAPQSVVFLLLVLFTAAAYCASFVLSICYAVSLRREKKRAAEGEE